MVLRILKSNRPFSFTFFAFLGILFWMKGFLKPELYPFYSEENKNLLYSPINSFFENSAFFSVLISFILVLILAFIIQFINGQFAFIRIRTMLPAPMFILLVAGITEIHTLHPVYFAALFLLLAINRLFGIFENKKPNSAVFDSGFLMGIGTLFYFDLLFILPAIILGIVVLQKITKIRLFIILFIGFLLPFIFTLGYGIYTETLFEILTVFEHNIISVNKHFPSNLPLLIFLGFTIFLTALASIRIIQQYDTKKVSTRKYFTVFFLIFLFSLFSLIFVPAVSREMLIIMFIPICYLISNYLVFMKSKFWGELIVTLIFGIVIYMQIVAFSNG